MTRKHCLSGMALLTFGLSVAAFAGAPAAPGGAPAEDINPKAIHLSAARSAVDVRDWKRAISHFRAALETDPADLDLRKELAGVLFTAGYVDQALAEYDRILETASHRHDVRDAAVTATMAIRDFDAAISRLLRYPRARRKDRAYRLRLARAYAWSKRPGQALPLYEGLVREAPGQRETYREYLAALLAANEWSALARESAAYLERWPDDVQVCLYRIDVLLRGDDVGAAVLVLQALARNPAAASDDVWVRLGDLQLACGFDLETVRAMLEEASARRAAPKVRVRLAVLYAYDGQFHRAFAALERAGKEGAPVHQVMAARAELYALAGMYRTALRQFAALLRVDRADARALKGMARAAAPLQRLDQAKSALLRALIQCPGDMDATYQYVRLLEERGETKEALAVVNAVIAGAPQSPTARLLLGRLLTAAGQREKAGEAFAFVTERLVETGTDAMVRTGRITETNLRLVPPAVWRDVIVRAPGDEAARAHLAGALYREARLGESSRVWEALVAAQPQNPHYTLGLVGSLVARGLHARPENRKRVTDALDFLLQADALSQADAARLAELLAKMEKWEEVVAVTTRSMQKQADDVHATALHAGALLALGREDEALAVIERYLAAKPDNVPARFRLWARLGDFARSKDDTAYARASAGLRKILDEEPANLDVSHALARLATTHKDYDSGRGSLERILDAAPGDADALLWRARLESWDGEYDASLEYYGRYAAANPSDRRVHLERARVLGWALRFQEALDAYSAGIRAEGADDPPGDGASDWARALYLEREAKRYRWHDRARRAVRMQDELLVLRPNDPELLFDRGQMATRFGFSRRAADYYERTLLFAPGHIHARNALDYERRRLNARVRETYSFRREKGFDDNFEIEEQLLTTTIWSPELGVLGGLGTLWWLGAEVERGWYHFDGFRDPTVRRYKLMARKRLYSGLEFDGWLRRSRYTVTSHTTTNFGLGASCKVFDFLDTGLTYAREDVLENFPTMNADIQRDVYAVTLAAACTRRLSADIRAAWVQVDDGNDGRRVRGGAAWELLRYPRILKLAYLVEYWGYDSDNRVYFSPREFIQHGPSLHWRHYLNTEHYSGVNELYYGIRAPLLFDNHRHPYFNVGIEFLWDITNQWQLGGDATLIRSQPYDGTFAKLWLQYRF